MLKIALIINDVIEKNRIKSFLNRSKTKLEDFEFELIREFKTSRKAVNFFHQNKQVDILIVENSTGDVFEGLDFLMLTENEFPETTIILLTEKNEELKLQLSGAKNLASIITKEENYNSFINKFLLAILKQKSKKEKLKNEEIKLNDYRTIIDHTNDAIFLIDVDCDGNFYYKRINKTHQRLTALSNEEIRGKSTSEIFNKEVADRLEANYRKCLENKKHLNYIETIEFPAGKKIWQTSLYPVIRNGRVEEIVGGSYDITEMEKKQQRLNYSKNHDSLTSLYNKPYFDKVFLKLNKEDNSGLALILIDINNFYLVNEFFSYQKGDQILKEIGSILANKSDQDMTAAHLSADQFAVILTKKSYKKREEIFTLIKEKINNIKIEDIELDISVILTEKKDAKLTANKFFNQGVGKIKLDKNKKSKNSKFYFSMIKYIENNYREIRHSSELLHLTGSAADAFNLSKKDKEKLLLLARHHDIGKLAIKKNILKKGNKLNDYEWNQYQKHLIISANFAASYCDLNEVYDLIYHHHEHFDGSGWPENLQGEEIPYLNRLFAVINFYDLLSSNLFFPFLKNKYYFAELQKDEILEELKKYKGKVFDPKIVDNFIKYIKY